jgi:hypothetical protein
MPSLPVEAVPLILDVATGRRGYGAGRRGGGGDV